VLLSSVFALQHERLPFRHSFCVLRLNLSVNAGLDCPEFSPFWTKVKALVSLFRTSRNLQDALRQTQVYMTSHIRLFISLFSLCLNVPHSQKDNNEKVGCLIQSEPTRWQSAHDSAASVLYLKDDLITVVEWAIQELDNGPRIEEAMLDNHEWALLKEIQPTLSQLRHVWHNLSCCMSDVDVVLISLCLVRFLQIWKASLVCWQEKFGLRLL
jgi:hypothetical protein